MVTGELDLIRQILLLVPCFSERVFIHLRRILGRESHLFHVLLHEEIYVGLRFLCQLHETLLIGRLNVGNVQGLRV